MQILLIGSGGREHALAWKMSQSPLVERIFTAPGNPGTASIDKNENIDIPVDDLQALVAFASTAGIDLTVVGPEKPLSLGLVDQFAHRGLKIFGPTKAAAQLEASKAFAKEVMNAAKVPTASHRVFQDIESARTFLNSQTFPIVLKEDGLAQGKGVLVAQNRDEAVSFAEKIFKSSLPNSKVLVIEEFLEGEEVSFFAMCDGTHFIPFANAQDHKRLLNGDRGPNTGGMGAYSPAPIFDTQIQKTVETTIIEPVLQEMIRRGSPYQGILFVGLMLTKTGPKVLEFNARFGDPETQVILPRLEDDLVELLHLAVRGRLSGRRIRWSTNHAITVVLASRGYPESPTSGDPISGADLTDKDLLVFQAGTKLLQNRLVTSGGRVLSVTALGNNLIEAKDRAYRGVRKISYEGMQYRTDIGFRAMK